jgi:hypothetical protein
MASRGMKVTFSAPAALPSHVALCRTGVGARRGAAARQRGAVQLPLRSLDGLADVLDNLLDGSAASDGAQEDSGPAAGPPFSCVLCGLHGLSSASQLAEHSLAGGTTLIPLRTRRGGFISRN